MPLNMQSLLTVPMPFLSPIVTHCKGARTDEDSVESYARAEEADSSRAVPDIADPEPPEKSPKLVELEKQGRSISSDA